MLFQESSRQCAVCGNLLKETSLKETLEITRKKSFKQRIGTEDTETSDAYKQYFIRKYLGDGSLFLLYDLCKNRLKHGSKPERFFIQPVDFTALLNIPWFFFNIISTNMFHMQYISFCRRCNCKSIPAFHSPEECDYNIEYFNILDDILSGDIVDTKKIYEEHTKEKKLKGEKSAYNDLFNRKVRKEVFFDVLSIGLSVLFWLFIAVYVSYPMLQALMQKLEYLDAYEWTF